MMTGIDRRIVVAAGLVLLAFLAAWWWRDRPSAPSDRTDERSGEIAANPPAPLSSPVPPAVTTPAARDGGSVVALPGRDEMITELNTPSGSVAGDLGIVAEIVNAYQTVYQTVPPGGLNDEITACLTGANPKRIAFLPADHPSISASGELLDRWGTPFFFHPVSGEILDLRSAGPDGELWTADDVHLPRSDPRETLFLGSPP